MLIDAGAPVAVSARGDGGTPLVVALFWGHQEVSELLAGHSRAPGNLRVAAGLGGLEMLTSLFDSEGRPIAAAGAHRGFYRPHGGFPGGTPSPEPGEALNEALSWAARSDRTEALSFLVDRGADLEADVYRGTALAWAAATGRVAAIRRLVELGADPSGRSSFGGPDHGRQLTPLHLAARNGDRVTVKALLDLGADPHLKDGLYNSTPAGWAEEFNHRRVAELIREVD
jgi:hypothetical protein